MRDVTIRPLLKMEFVSTYRRVLRSELALCTGWNLLTSDLLPEGVGPATKLRMILALTPPPLRLVGDPDKCRGA